MTISKFKGNDQIKIASCILTVILTCCVISASHENKVYSKQSNKYTKQHTTEN